jgi:hypothetical protein
MTSDITTGLFGQICHQCGCRKGKSTTRLPRGWKARANFAYCADCWAKNYLLRVVAIPVASPVDLQWKEFRSVLQEMWAATTQASNWFITELYARDVRRGDELKMPAMPTTYLYPEARRRFPNLPPQTLSVLEQKLKRCYTKVRYDVIWRCAASLPTYRYPAPFPVSNQSWSVQTENNCFILNVRVGNERVRLRLKSGSRYRYQLDLIEKIASGGAVQSELSISQRNSDVMCKLVAWFPRLEVRDQRTGTMLVRTSPDALIVASNARAERLWIYNGDQLRRWQAEHRRQLQRWAEDKKAEFRPIPPFAERTAAAVQKYRDRMHTACHTVAAIVVNKAVRSRFSVLSYDDSDHGFCEEFPWFDLRRKIQEKCDAAGLGFEHPTASTSEPHDRQVNEPRGRTDFRATG